MFNNQEKWDQLDLQSRITCFNSRATLLAWKFKFISKFKKEDIILDFLKLVFEFIQVDDYELLIETLKKQDTEKLKNWNKIIRQNDQDYLLNHFLMMDDYEKLFKLFWYSLGEIKTPEQVIELWHQKAKFLNLDSINFSIGNYTINYNDINDFMINKIKKGFKV